MGGPGPLGRRRSPARDLLALLWKVPLFATPFAVFFVIVTGAPFSAFPRLYLVSLTFSAFTTFGTWITHHWLEPAVVARRPDDPLLVFKVSGLYTGVALLFGIAAALLMHFTFMPGFLGSARAVM